MAMSQFPHWTPIAPEELLQFTSCNCHGDCSTKWYSCKKNGVQYIFLHVQCVIASHAGIPLMMALALVEEIQILIFNNYNNCISLLY